MPPASNTDSDSFRLELASEPHEVVWNIQTFCRGHQAHRDRAVRLSRDADYWVFSGAVRLYAPAKFVGFRNMDFDHYEACVAGKCSGAKFNGNTARQRLERVLRMRFYEDQVLGSKLLTQLEDWFGSGEFEGVNRAKWRFACVLV
jgi:hypothetical protein